MDRINVAYPHQQVEPLTAREWFRHLRDYRADEVDRALVHCLGTVQFISCYALAEAVHTERATRTATQSTVTPLPAHGVPMPPETRAALEVLKRSTLLPDNPDYLPPEKARQRVDELAGYLQARQNEESSAPMRERPA